MSKVKIQGNASGTGVVTLTAPNTNTDRTITLPDEDITLGGGVDGIVSSANATAITIDSNENIGIGVTPENWGSNHTALDLGYACSLVSGNAANGGYVDLSAGAYYDGTNWKYKNNSEAVQYELDDWTGKHYFKVAPSGTADSAISWTTAMTINNDGDINFGTFSSTGASSGKWMDAGTNAFEMKSSANTTNNKRHLGFYNPNGEVGSIRTSGTSTSYNTSSDYRLKENVVPMTGSIDRLKELKPSRFNFIADADTTVDGFLAHEAQEVVPEAVTGEKDAMRMEEYEVTPAVKDDDGNVVTEAVMGTREVEDYQGIDQAKLVPLLTASLQEAVEKIEALEARVTTLEGGTV